MNNLEEEYKKSQQEDTPDLWDSIEAKLPPKKVKSKKIIYLTRYLSAAAAVIVLFTLIPGLLRLTKDSNHSDLVRNQMYEASPQDNQPDAGIPQSQESMDVLGEEPDEEAILTEPEEALREDLSDRDSLMNLSEMAVKDYYEESMQVISSTEEGMDIIYTLQTLEGREITAVLSKELEHELIPGETYLFTLQAADASDWEYIIEEVK